jgi:hypothetical protein
VGDVVDHLSAGTARGYAWPPFEPGNEAATKHGADSARRIEPIATRLASELAEQAPWTAGGQYAAAVHAWAWTEAQAVLLRKYLDEHGLIDEAGEPRAASARLDKVETRAVKLREQLGLTPLSMVKLMAGLSSIEPGAAQGGLDALKAAGRQIRTAASEPAALDDGAGLGEVLPSGEVVGADLDGALPVDVGHGDLLDGRPGAAAGFLASGHGIQSDGDDEQERGPDAS